MRVKTNQPPSSQRDLIEYRFTQVFEELKDIKSKMDTFSFVKQSDFNDFVKEVREEYVKRESIKGLQAIGVGVAVTVTAAILLGLLKLLGTKL